MQNKVLITENLTKDYGEGRGALDISFEVKEGEVVGFVGPNGAGKSTTMEMIMGLIKPNYGYRSIFGLTIKNKIDMRKALSHIGYLPAEGGLYENLTARQVFNYASKLYGFNFKKNIQFFSEKLKLDLDKQVKKLSLGNKKKIGIIQAIIHGPKLLILDEPTSGLDPLIQKEILQIIKDLANRKKSVFLSSHNLSEVQSVCDRIIMIKNAKIIFNGSVSEILDTAEREIILVRPPKIILDRIVNIVGEEVIEQVGEECSIRVKRIAPIVKVLLDYDYENYYIQKPSLESRFISFY